MFKELLQKGGKWHRSETQISIKKRKNVRERMNEGKINSREESDAGLDSYTRHILPTVQGGL